jgi:uncharacterized protein
LKLAFTLLPERMAITRLEHDAPSPAWATRGAFTSVTRTPSELSIVCQDDSVPRDVASARGWRGLMLQGPFPLTETGIASDFTAVLARANVSVFVISTYETDFVLVPEKSLDVAIAALARAGHSVSR